MFSSVFGRMVLVAFGLLASLASAHAAVYVGEWDPPYGPPFQDLGWRGSATVFVPQACIVAGGFVDNATACGGNAAVTSAQVELYSLTDPMQTTYKTLVYDPLTLVINELVFAGGNLVGLITTLSNFVLDDTGNTGGASFALGFDYDTNVVGGYKGPFLDYASGENTGSNSIQPTIVFAQVAEPMSLALAGAALAALGWARRRRPRR